MRQITKALLVDRSTPEEFHFVLRCKECGREWRSPHIRFSKSGIQPQTEGKRVIFQSLYYREWERARERAAEEASEEFNLCPICGRLVCNHCFLICEDLDICVSCAERLHECGAPVLEKTAD